MYLKLILKQILSWLYIVMIIFFYTCIAVRISETFTNFFTEGVVRNVNPMDYVRGTAKSKTVDDDNKSNDYKVWYYFGITIVGIFNLAILLHCFCRSCMEFIIRVTSNLYTNFRNLIQLINLRTIIRNLSRLNFFRAPPVDPAVPRDNLVQFLDDMVVLDPRALYHHEDYSSDEEI